MTDTVSSAPPHVEPAATETGRAGARHPAEAGGSTTGTPRTTPSGRTAAGRSPAATCAGRSSPSSSASWSGSSGASSSWRCPKRASTLDTGEIFWLISIPSLVGATLRIPYSFLVPKFGGRNWTIISAALLLIPAIMLAVCRVRTPRPRSACCSLAAALAGFGGGNFASSMSNITFFYPQREKGWALGLNAAGGNLGASVAQFVVPIVITIGAGAALNLPLAGWIWVPLILAAMWGAFRYMDNLSNAKADFAGSAAALKEPHLWIMSVLYIGTFGSFIGFASVFPKLIADQFPEFSTIAVGGASVGLAFLGALVGSLARPYGGRLSDRFGGARITMVAFAAMGTTRARRRADAARRELLALPRALPPAVRVGGHRQRLDVPHGADRVRAPRLG